MNTITAIISAIILATAIAVAPVPANDTANLIGPPATFGGDTIAPVGPPATFDGDTRSCLSCTVRVQPRQPATGRR